MRYLCCTVPKLGQDFGSVVWDDAHGVTGQVELLQTGQRANVPDLLQLEMHTNTQQEMSSEADGMGIIWTNQVGRLINCCCFLAAFIFLYVSVKAS